MSTQDAYIYATSEKYEKKVRKEAEAYEKIGIEGGLVDSFPLDIDVKNVLVMKNQAQFHPTKYLVHLIQHITEKGGLIFENTTAVNIETGEKPVVLTRGELAPKITAKHVLACSHFPFYEGLGLYSTRMHADRAYALAVKAKKEIPKRHLYQR